MINFLILCGKNGIPLETIGELPQRYNDGIISGLAVAVNYYSKEFKENKIIHDKDFTIYLSDNEPPYAKGIDGSIIRIIEGRRFYVVASTSEEEDLLPAYNLLEKHDIPINYYGRSKIKDLSSILEDLAFTQVSLYKARKLN